MRTLKNLVGMIARIADELEKTNARLDRLVECWEAKPVPKEEPVESPEPEQPEPVEVIDDGILTSVPIQEPLDESEGENAEKKPKCGERWENGDIEALVKMNSEGKSRKEIAAALGVDYTRVATKLYSLGLRAR